MNCFKESPKKVFTDDGYLDFLRHIGNSMRAIDFITNHIDELEPDSELEDALYNCAKMFEFLYEEYVKTAIKT